jgi:sortase A
MTEWRVKRSHRRRARSLGRLGHALITAGVVVLLFGGYQLIVTDTLQHSTQTQLTTEVRRILPSGSAPRVLGTATPLPRSLDPGEGHWVGVLSIPAIKLQQVIVNGTTVNDLRLGPGHYLGTPMPGEAGNVAIAGHRTTWGRPFRNLDHLKRGDQIVIATPRADVLYRVAWQRVVAPTDLSVIGPSGTNSLTLTTCHPAYSAAQRLIVRAELVAVGHVRRTPVSITETQSRTITSDIPRPSAWHIVIWGSLALAVYLLTWRFVRRTRRRALVIVAGLLVGTPLLLALFNAVSWQLPAGY